MLLGREICEDDWTDEAGIPRRRHRHPRRDILARIVARMSACRYQLAVGMTSGNVGRVGEDPREDVHVGVGVGVGAVEFQLEPNRGGIKSTTFRRPQTTGGNCLRPPPPVVCCASCKRPWSLW